MRRSKILLGALLLALATGPAVGAHAQTDRPAEPPPSAAERLQEGAAALVDGLRLLMDQLQSYQPPEVLPNGDIIIRRAPPAEAEPAPSKPSSPPSDGAGPRSL